MYEITTGSLASISFSPKTELEEVLQNVRCILSTPRFSVPLDREFGIDGTYVDKPMETAKGKLVADIVLTVAKYEPRVTVTNVLWETDPDGVLKAKVQVSLNELE